MQNLERRPNSTVYLNRVLAPRCNHHRFSIKVAIDSWATWLPVAFLVWWIRSEYVWRGEWLATSLPVAPCIVKRNSRGSRTRRKVVGVKWNALVFHKYLYCWLSQAILFPWNVAEISIAFSLPCCYALTCEKRQNHEVLIWQVITMYLIKALLYWDKGMN